jgi:hypothetical protein
MLRWTAGAIKYFLAGRAAYLARLMCGTSGISCLGYPNLDKLAYYDEINTFSIKTGLIKTTQQKRKNEIVSKAR